MSPLNAEQVIVEKIATVLNPRWREELAEGEYDTAALSFAKEIVIAIRPYLSIGLIPHFPAQRMPYVGEGVEGSLASAQIDLSEADQYPVASPDWERCMASAAAWNRQAAAEARLRWHLDPGDPPTDVPPEREDPTIPEVTP